jgi:hypothetical protein
MLNASGGHIDVDTVIRCKLSNWGGGGGWGSGFGNR